MPIILFIFSGCVVGDKVQLGWGLHFPQDNYKYLHWCFFNCEPDLCEIAEDEDNIISTQMIDLLTIKENQTGRKGDQFFLACLAKPNRSKILVESDSLGNTYLYTSNVYGHANG